MWWGTKKCLEIKSGRTETIWNNAPVSNEKYKCKLKNGECNEVEKKQKQVIQLNLLLNLHQNLQLILQQKPRLNLQLKLKLNQKKKINYIILN